MLKKYQSFLRSFLLEEVENPSTLDRNPFLQKKKEKNEAHVPDEKAETIIRKSMSQIAAKYGFFWDLLTKLDIKEATPSDIKELELDTMCTDGKSILYNPDFVIAMHRPDKKPNDCEMIKWVLCHEIGHVMLFHFRRMGERNPSLWNSAGDYAINLLLEGIGEIPLNIKHPKAIDNTINPKTGKPKNPEGIIFRGPLIDPAYTNMSAEVIYDVLAEKNPPPPKADWKCPKCGGSLSGAELEVDAQGQCWIICPHCGERIKTKKPQGSGKGKEPVCPECEGDLKGAKIEVSFKGTHWVVCPHCGAKIPIPPGGSGEGEGDGEGDGEGQGDGKGKPGKGKGKGGKGAGATDQKPEDLTEGEMTGEDNMENDVMRPGDLDGRGKTVIKGWDESEGALNPEEIEKRWFTNRQVSAQRYQGMGSETLKRWIKSLTQNEVNWRRALQRFIEDCYAKVGYKLFDPRLGATRGYPSGPSTAKATQEFDNAVICVDTSGSITDQDLAVFAAEMHGIIKARGLKTLRVIWCDAQVCSIQVFGDKKKLYPKEKYSGPVKNFHLKLEPCGGGGTSFVPPFKWMNDNLFKNRIKPAFIVYFTDAAGDAPNPAMVRGYEDRVMWVVHPANSDCSALGAQDDWVDKDDKGKVITNAHAREGRRRWRIIKVNGLKPRGKS